MARRAIVLSVRGTMSVQDCITDSMYKPVLLNADAINMPHLSGAQLHCHAGVVTATNYILSDLNRHQILHKVFFGNNCKMDDSTLSKSAPYLVGETQTERESWTLVLCGHSLGAGVATVLALHLRRVFQNIRVWGIEPPGGLLSAELAASCREWTVSITHGCDIITRLSGPCLLKLRRDLVDALVRCKLNKFSLLMRMTCAPDSVEESDLLLEPGCEAHEATILRRDFEQFHVKQIDERPLMAAPLYPPGRLLHLRRKSSGKRSPTASIRDMYEARGTMSVQDCITDSMYKPVLLNADAINMPHLSGAQLHCHAGVVTATNYILSDLNRHQILHKVFFGNNCKMDDSTLSKSAPYLVGETQTERESWTLVLCGHSLGAGVATVLALHLRRVFQNIRVWGIEPPGGLLSAELAASCREWTVSITHGCDIITRLSGPCLLKLRRDLVDALVRCKLNKFSLLMRMTCAPDSVEESDLLLEPGCEAHEATILRRDFEQFHVKQIDERPLMAAPLYPPGRLLHLRRKSSGKRSPTASIRDMYEARWISAQELMFQGLLVNETFFTDHFPDKVVAVLSELALMS